MGKSVEPTPLIAGPGGDEVTRQVFGDYVSLYDFQQSVEDNATLPLYYENRTPELEITNPDLDAELLAVVEAADLNEEGDRCKQRTKIAPATGLILVRCLQLQTKDYGPQDRAATSYKTGSP